MRIGREQFSDPAAMNSVTGPVAADIFKTQQWHSSCLNLFCTEDLLHAADVEYPSSSPKMDDLVMLIKQLRRHSGICECCSELTPELGLRGARRQGGNQASMSQPLCLSVCCSWWATCWNFASIPSGSPRPWKWSSQRCWWRSSATSCRRWSPGTLRPFTFTGSDGRHLTRRTLP